MKKAILVFMLLFGCATTVPKDKDLAFTVAVEAVQRDRMVEGAKAAWSFIESADPDDPRYDRGLRLLARSSEGLGLYWAAGMLYREIAQVRRNTELVPDALRALERMTRRDAVDEDSFITAFIAAEMFGDLPRDVQAFVDYQQGLDLARRGADKWADKRFESIPPQSPYATRAQYVKTIRRVANGEMSVAMEELKALLETEDLPKDVMYEIERTMARVEFERKNYKEALAHFESIQELAPDDPEILLEMAWTYYYLGDSRKTLGLLIALDAPVHASYISPERYLLEALALRRLCQFGAARQAAVRLENKYAESIRALSEGILPENIPEMRSAARQRGFSRGNAQFLDRLNIEIALAGELSEALGKSLATFLGSIYTRGRDEARKREEVILGPDIESLTEELLSAREGVRLIVHELGVSLLRGRRRPGGAIEKPAVEVPLTGELIFFAFEGEYWTDEMDDLVVIAEDRCIE